MTNYKLHFKRKFIAPLYKANIWVTVSNSIDMTRQDMKHILGEPAETSMCAEALCCYNHDNGSFAVMFDVNWLKKHKMAVLSHEVFHLTHAILEWVSANFDPAHHEQGAYLHAYLMDRVYGMVKKFM